MLWFGFFKVLLTNKFWVYVVIQQSEAIFLLSKEKQGPHLKTYKFNSNKVIKKF